jgi:hypothetical protein
MIEDFTELMDFSWNRIYYLSVIARKKNNPGLSGSETVLATMAVKDREAYPFTLEVCRAVAKVSGLKCYIYITVNARNPMAAYRIFKMKMAECEGDALDGDVSWGDGPEQFFKTVRNLDRIWISCLNKPDARGQKNYLIDVDSKDPEVIEKVKQGLANWSTKGYNVEILLKKETLNGYHLVTIPFPVDLFKDMKNVEVKTDGLLFLEAVGFD